MRPLGSRISFLGLSRPPVSARSRTDGGRIPRTSSGTPAGGDVKARARITPSRLSTHLALAPALLIALVAYCGGMGWTIWISFTNSRMLPSSVFVGLRQYDSLSANERWLTSVQNIFLFGALFILAALTLGFLFAALIDQRVRGEALFRSIFLYPFSMSFIVTGLAWRWLLEPRLGVFAPFGFDWLVRPDRVIYTLVFAAVWHASGLVMAIMLAGLRGVDPEIWKATRVDGIPSWRVYLFIIIPLVRGSFATALILLAVSVARLYDLSVAMTNGGPGIASEVPAKFVMDHLFDRGNVGLATAAATTMLITVVAVLAPLFYWRHYRPMRRPA